MIQQVTKIAALLALSVSAPVMATSSDSFRAGGGASQQRELPPYLQCVPYARQQSGIEIYGDAHTWWGKAKGVYKRGQKPRVGAVMAFRPHRNMRLGHVAAVSRVVDSRTVLLRHSNWSPINGRRGQIENDVKAIDVSPNNDWSQVRVWYHPLQGLGKTAWPIHGFIYTDKAKKFNAPLRVAAAKPSVPVAKAQSSKAFLSAFAPAKRAPARQNVAAPKKSRVSVAFADLLQK